MTEVKVEINRYSNAQLSVLDIMYHLSEGRPIYESNPLCVDSFDYLLTLAVGGWSVKVARCSLLAAGTLCEPC